MLYLTLKDDPFPDQEHDENALLELVRTVARRDGDDRTISELIRFQDALERLGLLWTPLDALDKYQAQELVRNLHLELTAPGDMVYLKHSPAMRSYVVLRGVVLLTNNVLDREGNAGARALGPGEEFGHPLDPDLDLDKPVADFLEYAKAPHLDVLHDGGSEVAALAAVRGGTRKDGRAELLVIGRQDWIATLQTCSDHFSRVLRKVSASKDPDPLKDEARVAFNYPAKGRKGEHLEIATKYLRERVAFCSDLPPEQVLAMATSVELRGFTVPGRDVFRRGRECYGEAYIMFTGSADQKGSDKSGDRLIKEGDLFGDEHFAVATKGDLGTPFRTATAMSRTAPCELLVIPTRECRRLQAFVAVRNSEKAMTIFEKFFINLPRETFSEIALLATFRTIKMHEHLAVAGEDVTAVFFVFRGECAASHSGRPQQKHQLQQKRKTNKGQPKSEQQRYGPGHIIGWPYVMPKVHVLGRGPTTTAKKTASREGAGVSRSKGVSGADAQGQPGKPQQEAIEQAKKRRPRRNMEEWQDTVTVTTPAQVLSVPLTTLLSFLSEKAMQGLRTYISMTHKQKLEETSLNLDDDDLDGFGEGDDMGWSSLSAAGREHSTVSAFGMDGSGHLTKDSTNPYTPPRPSDWRRPSTAPQLSPKRQGRAHVVEIDGQRRPNTTALIDDEAEKARGEIIGGSCSSRNHPQLQARTNTPTRWRWRVGPTDVEAATNRSLVSRGSRGSSRQRKSSPSLSSVVWGYARGGRGQEGRRESRGSGGRCCSCPLESCRACSPSKRLERLRRAPVWVPSLPPRSTRKPDTAPAKTAAQSNLGVVTRDTEKRRPISSGWRPSTHGPAATTKTPAEVGSFPSFKLWSNTGDSFGMMTMTRGFSAGTSLDVKRPEARGGCSSSADQKGAMVVGAPTSDFGVTIAGAGGGRKTDDGSEMSLPPAVAAVTVPDRRFGGRLSYTLVQLSTRADLGPCGAETGLFLRVLGSFSSEAEATTRVLNLYHSVLPAKVAWDPCQGTPGRVDDHMVSSCLDHSDHLFLLRRGVVAARLAFDVAPKGAENSDIHRGNRSNFCDGSSHDNSRSDNISSGIPKANPEEDIGRGYDASIPAVFKAKGQQFAVAFVSSADRAGKEWDQHQHQILEKEQEEALASQNMPLARISGIEGTDGVEGGGSSASSSGGGGSSRSVSPPDGASPQVGGTDEPDEESSGLDVVQTLKMNDDDRAATEETASACRDGVGEGGEAPPDDKNGAAAEGGGGSSDVDTAKCSAGTRHGDEGFIGDDDERSADAAEDAEADEEKPEGGDGHHGARGRETAAFGGRLSRRDVLNVGSGGVSGERAKIRLFADELLDGSETESSEGLEGGGRRRGNWMEQGAGGRQGSALHGDGTSETGSGGDAGSEEKAHRRRDALSWIISRMGCLEEVEGCYETEAKAFRKAIEILGFKSEAGKSSTTVQPVRGQNSETLQEAKEKALAATQQHAGTSEPRAEENQNKGHPSARHSPLSRQPQKHSPQRQNLRPRNETRVACILPLYEWLPLGDDFEGVFDAIGSRSIADPSEVARAGVDPLALWTEQRARRLRTNLYNLLRAAGPREIRSRCGVAMSDEGQRGGRGRKMGRHTCDDGGVTLMVDEGIVGQRDLRSLGRKKAAKEAVRAARASVLTQNQKLIQTETSVRRRAINATATETTTGTVYLHQKQGQPHIQASAPDISYPEGSRTGAAKSAETAPIADGPASVDGAGTWSGTGGGRGAGGGSVGDQDGSGKRGARHELRVQMNIERKRARLFEDIQTLPYIGARRSTKNTKAGTKSGAGDRGNKMDEVKPIDQVRPGRTGAPPPAMTLRAPKVQAEKRLHGKPPSSFFSRVHAAGSTHALASGATATPEEAHRSSTYPAAGTAAAAAEVTQRSPTVVEQPAVAVVAAKPQPAQSATGLEPDHDPANAASNFSTCASTLGSSVSTAKGGHDVAGEEWHSESPAASSQSMSDRENTSLSETPHGAFKSTSSIKHVRAGVRGVGVKAAKTRGGDGWSTSRVPEGVCSLDEELILLDGILHDRKIRTWVETTLAPSRKHRQHHHQHQHHA